MGVAVIKTDGQYRAVPDYVDSIAELRAHASLTLLVKEAADTLERHYPGWTWAIRPDEAGGIIDVMCMRISTRFGYTLHVKRLQNDPTFREVVRAGGEFLERFGFRRVPYSIGEWRRREQVMGQFIPDVSDMDAMRRRTVRTDAILAGMESGHVRITTDPRIGAALKERRA